MSAPAKPRPVRDAARLIVLGVSLGVAALVLEVLIASQIATALHDHFGSEPSVWTWILSRLFYEQIGVLLVAPALAFVCGLLVDGPRSVLAAGMVVTLQGARATMSAAIFGLASVTDPVDIGLFLGYGALGIALCIWVMGRGQRLARRGREQKPAAPEPKLAEIDFEAVKRQQEAAQAESKPAAPAPPTGTDPKPQG